MKVKIVSCGKSTYWYADRIGEIVEVSEDKRSANGFEWSYPVIDSKVMAEQKNKDGYTCGLFIDVVDSEVVE